MARAGARPRRVLAQRSDRDEGFVHALRESDLLPASEAEESPFDVPEDDRRVAPAMGKKPRLGGSRGKTLSLSDGAAPTVEGSKEVAVLLSS